MREKMRYIVYAHNEEFKSIPIGTVIPINGVYTSLGGRYIT
jgi:hypothetical protein